MLTENRRNITKKKKPEWFPFKKSRNMEIFPFFIFSGSGGRSYLKISL
jgi:hypothetical protein